LAVKISGGGELDGAVFQNAATEDTLQSILSAIDSSNKRKDQNDEADQSGTDKAQAGLSAFGDTAKAIGKGSGKVALAGLDAVAGSTLNLLKGQYKLTDMTKVLETSFNNVGTGSKFVDSAFNKLGLGVSGTTKFLVETADTYREMSSVGAGLEGDLMELRRVAANTRMPLDEFAGMVSQNSEKLLSMGGSVDKGTRAFAQTAKQFYDSRLGLGVQALGINFEENNELLLDYMDAQRRNTAFQNLSEQERMKKAQQYIYELDTIAKLTGKNRKELQADAKQRANDGAVQASLRLMEMKGIKGAQAEFESMQKGLAPLGGGMQDMFSAMVRLNGSIDPTIAGQQELYAAMGPAAGTLSEAAKAFKAGDMEKARKLQEQAIAEGTQRMASADFNRIAELGSVAGGVGDAAKGQMEASGRFLDAVIKNSEALQKGATDVNSFATAIRNATTSISESQTRAQQSASMGMVVGMETTLRDSSAALYNTIDTEFKAPLTDMMTSVRDLVAGIDMESIQSFTDKVGQAAGSMVPGAGDSIQTTIDKLTKVVEQTTDEKTKTNAAELIKVLEEHQATLRSAESSPDQRQQAQASADTIKQLLAQQAAGTPVDAPKRKDGSIGAVGKLFEDFGKETLVALHGKEGIIKPDQLQAGLAAFAEQMMTAQPQMSKTIQKPATDTAKPELAEQSATTSAAPDTAVQDSMKELVSMLSTKMDESKGALDQLHRVAQKQVGAIKSQGLDVAFGNLIG
jgi:hypothetical protein